MNVLRGQRWERPPGCLSIDGLEKRPFFLDGTSEQRSWESNSLVSTYFSKGFFNLDQDGFFFFIIFLQNKKEEEGSSHCCLVRNISVQNELIRAQRVFLTFRIQETRREVLKALHSWFQIITARLFSSAEPWIKVSASLKKKIVFWQIEFLHHPKLQNDLCWKTVIGLFSCRKLLLVLLLTRLATFLRQPKVFKPNTGAWGGFFEVLVLVFSSLVGPEYTGSYRWYHRSLASLIQQKCRKKDFLTRFCFGCLMLQ